MINQSGRQILLIGNDNSAILSGLKDAISGDYIVSATVTLTIKNAAGDDVEGATGIPMIYTAPDDIDADLLAEIDPDGNYIGVIEDGVTLSHLAKYTAVIDANAGSGRIGKWEIPIIARRRTS